MKLKKDFEMVQLMDEYIAVSVGKAAEEFRGVIRMNRTGAFIWNAIRDGADTREKILEKMRAAYEELDETAAREDIDLFLETAKAALEE